ncbi:hypothetical protein KKD57_01305 [Patescibacteria group bacterium]|nr:hypothetical protein [Patescibacteria group bacterium]
MIEILTILFSVIAIIISIYSWQKSRAIYDIEKYKFPKNVGGSKTDEDEKHEQALKEKLKTGNWQILHIYERNVNNELMIVIGKIKK